MKIVSHNDYNVTIKEGFFKRKRTVSYREYFDLVFPMFDNVQELDWEIKREGYRSFLNNHAECVSCCRDLVKQRFKPVSVVLCSRDGTTNDDVNNTSKRVSFSSVEMFRDVTAVGDVIELGDRRFVRVSNIIWKIEGKDNYMNDFDLVMLIVFHKFAGK
nr:MAG TPA: hypothetical protein [Caudoviricetes sp.]